MRWYVLLLVLLAMEPQLAAAASRNLQHKPSGGQHRAPMMRELEVDWAQSNPGAESKVKPQANTMAQTADRWQKISTLLTMICVLLFIAEVVVFPDEFNLIHSGRQFGRGATGLLPDSGAKGLTSKLTDTQKKVLKDAKRGMIIATGITIFLSISYFTFYEVSHSVSTPSRGPVLDYMSHERGLLQRDRDLQGTDESLLEIESTQSTDPNDVSLTRRHKNPFSDIIKRKKGRSNYRDDTGLSVLWNDRDHSLYAQEGDYASLAKDLLKWYNDHPRDDMPLKITAHYMKKHGYKPELVEDLMDKWDADRTGDISEYELQFLGDDQHVETKLFEGPEGAIAPVLILCAFLSMFVLITTTSFTDRSLAFIGLAVALMVCGLLLSKVWYQLHQSSEGHKQVFAYFAEIVQSGCTRFAIALIVIMSLAALYNRSMGRCLPASFECANGAVPICISTGFPPQQQSCGTGFEGNDFVSFQCPMCDYSSGECLTSDIGSYKYSKFGNMLEWTKDAVCLDEKAPIEMSYFASEFSNAANGKCEVAESYGSPVCNDKSRSPYCKTVDTADEPGRRIAYVMSSNYLQATETQNLLKSVDPRTASDWPPTAVALAAPGSGCQVKYATELIKSEWCRTATTATTTANVTIDGVELGLDAKKCPARSFGSCHSSCGSCYSGDEGLSYRAEDLCTSCPPGMNLKYVQEAGSHANAPYRCHGKCLPQKVFQNKPYWCSFCDECDPLTRSYMAIRTPEHETGRSTYDLCYTNAVSYKEEDPTDNTTWHKVNESSVMSGTPAACGSNNCKRADFTDSIGNNYLDSLYFALVTHTTIGYGDISPTSNRGYLIVVLHALLMIVFGFLL